MTRYGENILVYYGVGAKIKVTGTHLGNTANVSKCFTKLKYKQWVAPALNGLVIYTFCCLKTTLLDRGLVCHCCDHEVGVGWKRVSCVWSASNVWLGSGLSALQCPTVVVLTHYIRCVDNWKGCFIWYLLFAWCRISLLWIITKVLSLKSNKSKLNTHTYMLNCNKW